MYSNVTMLVYFPKIFHVIIYFVKYTTTHDFSYAARPKVAWLKPDFFCQIWILVVGVHLY